MRCPDLNRDRVVNTTDGNSLYTFFGTDNYREDYDLNNDSGLTIAGNPIGDLGCLGNNLGNATSVIPECQLTCKDYDANGDNVVNPSDYTYIRGKMGCDFNNGTACRRADVNRDGVVNPSDYTKVRGKIGSICEICNDGIDNNGNGMIDCMDNECLVECVRY